MRKKTRIAITTRMSFSFFLFLLKKGSEEERQETEKGEEEG